MEDSPDYSRWTVCFIHCRPDRSRGGADGIGSGVFGIYCSDSICYSGRLSCNCRDCIVYWRAYADCRGASGGIYVDWQRNDFIRSWNGGSCVACAALLRCISEDVSVDCKNLQKTIS